jgi:MraZ protein
VSIFLGEAICGTLRSLIFPTAVHASFDISNCSRICSAYNAGNFNYQKSRIFFGEQLSIHMMPHRLFGEVSLTLDARSRITIPRTYLADLAAGIAVTRGVDQCIMIFPLPEWQNLTARINRLPLLNPLAREFCRLIFSGTSLAELAPSGYLVIPPDLRAYAGLEKDVILVGLGTHLEIWSSRLWSEQRHELESKIASDSQHWAALQI